MKAKGSFSSRLQSIMRNGNLTGADLARWFERTDPTVRTWISGEHGLRGAPLDVAYVEARLAKLETLLAKKRGLPVPRMKRRDRAEYMKKLATW